MSFFSKKYSNLKPYTPGEQPQDKKYIKLNTNENPFGLSIKVRREIMKNAKKFQLYPDPEAKKLRRVISSLYAIPIECIMLSNGSDEVLNFLFQGFCDNGAVFADITYGFYPVYASLHKVEYRTIPLDSDFRIKKEDYFNAKSTIFIANPNAPTGLTLSLKDIRDVLDNNKDSLVVIDEAYVDFGAESAVRLIKEYDNLVVVQTFSKSRSLAGLRLGMVFASRDIISQLNTLRYSVNPYNVNYAALAAGYAIIRSNSHTLEQCQKIINIREWTVKELEKLGFYVTDSRANFIFARSDKIAGEELYLKLKDRGILIRHFNTPRIEDFNRISIGDSYNMKRFVEAVKDILREYK